jgi:hypothetical protein
MLITRHLEVGETQDFIVLLLLFIPEKETYAAYNITESFSIL